MKYENYTIEHADQWNWTVTKDEDAVYDRDMKDRKTGSITHKKGDAYVRVIDLGYHSDYFKALRCVLHDKAPDCADDIEEVLANLKRIEQDLKHLKH
jgi:hypothetical protein